MENRHTTGKILPQALQNMLKKPVTVSYPNNRGDVFTNVRGKLIFDAEKCVGCNLCVRDCPTGAIKINRIEDKIFKATLNLGSCIFCGQCEDSCNKSALACSHEFELASLNRENMEIEL